MIQNSNNKMQHGGQFQEMVGRHWDNKNMFTSNVPIFSGEQSFMGWSHLSVSIKRKLMATVRRESVYGKSAGPLPPPPEVINYDNAVTNQILENAKAEKHSSSSESVCPICLTNPKDMAFACGHTTLALCV
ncbi:E3 ubiquitin-protein ligase RGLG4-like isoform X2 [Cucumis sativus]|uniref:E3 ubiquitin-protein ligase RGLG4-like isoform X2 n=1 Tax=Cucumis sativus TaxID=3659 RepID=UPI0012F48C79|nr:E3 ubiquitin-protein ligase RGLG4-like isoform X2 [Cucumis sativus]